MFQTSGNLEWRCGQTVVPKKGSHLIDDRIVNNTNCRNFSNRKTDGYTNKREPRKAEL